MIVAGVGVHKQSLTADEESAERLSEEQPGVLTAGFTTIPDQDPIEDVADWANAVLALLRDERA
jgi:hypothetical protein